MQSAEILLKFPGGIPIYSFGRWDYDFGGVVRILAAREYILDERINVKIITGEEENE